MKLLSSVIVAFVPLLVPLVAALFLADNGPLLILLDPALPPPIVHSSSSSENFLVEFAPGETRWVTESEKWRLRRHGQSFMDITNARDLGALAAATANRSPAIFPANLTKQDQVRELIEKLSKTNMQANLEQMTSFYTRYYKSDYGRQSSEWLLQTIVSAIAQSGADQHGTLAVPFPHNWVQSSIIATIPGRSNRTIVVGAHQDSINLWVPDVLPAPGADDDGSGTVTILEAFIALLRSDDIIHGHAENTIEFHFYSAEEGGLLGSQDIFKRYQAEGRDVRAMLQQDMTGFVLKTREAGLPESVAVVTDFVDPQLVAFTKLVIEEYCTIPWVETKCGYACSDHASASKAGYPAASAIEAQFALINNHAHTNQDQIKYLSFDHMLQHSVLTTAFVYELAFTNFDKTERDRSNTAAAAAGPSMDL